MGKLLFFPFIATALIYLLLGCSRSCHTYIWYVPADRQVKWAEQFSACRANGNDVQTCQQRANAAVGRLVESCSGSINDSNVDSNASGNNDNARDVIVGEIEI